MQTNAVVFARAEDVEIRTIEMPPPGPGQVQIRTHVSTISAGTEGWALRDLFTWAPTPFPCVPGYQRVGTIVAVGPDVADWQVGDRVMATNGQWEGPVAPFWGSHVACANTPVEQLFRIPSGAGDLDASTTVVAQVGYNAASRAVIEPGDWVVVYGDGLIGQSAAQAIRARGAKAILVGHRAERLALGAAHSADAAVNSHEQDVVAAVRSHTGSETVPVVLDTVQSENAQRQYVPLLETGRGQIVYSGFTPGKTWADMGLLQQRELTTHFVSGWTRERMDATLGLMAEGKMSLRPLITHHVPYARGPEMYRMILEKSPSLLGATLDWEGAEA